MCKGHKTVALAASTLFFLAAFLFFGLYPLGFADRFCGGGWGGAALAALLLVAVQFLVWLSARHFNLVFYAISFIPAICLWLFVCIGSSSSRLTLWLALSVALVDILLPESWLPESRETTQGWLGCCILLVMASMLPFLLEYALSLA